MMSKLLTKSAAAPLHKSSSNKYAAQTILKKQQACQIHSNNKANKKKTQPVIGNIPVEKTGKVAAQLSNKARINFLKRNSNARLAELRRNYREQYDTWFANYTEGKKQEFYNWRKNVMDYRAQKRQVSLHNIKQHENYMHHLGTEFARLRRERNQKRLNREAAISSYRVDQLRRLAKESKNFVAEDNIDEHIAKQLNPIEVLKPTIFSNRVGVNDEVGYELWSKIMADYHFQAELENIENKEDYDAALFERYKFDKIIRDPLYPQTMFLANGPYGTLGDALFYKSKKEAARLREEAEVSEDNADREKKISEFMDLLRPTQEDILGKRLAEAQTVEEKKKVLFEGLDYLANEKPREELDEAQEYIEQSYRDLAGVLAHDLYAQMASEAFSYEIDVNEPDWMVEYDRLDTAIEEAALEESTDEELIEMAEDYGYDVSGLKNGDAAAAQQDGDEATGAEDEEFYDDHEDEEALDDLLTTLSNAYGETDNYDYHLLKRYARGHETLAQSIQALETMEDIIIAGDKESADDFLEELEYELEDAEEEKANAAENKDRVEEEEEEDEEEDEEEEIENVDTESTIHDMIVPEEFVGDVYNEPQEAQEAQKKAEEMSEDMFDAFLRNTTEQMKAEMEGSFELAENDVVAEKVKSNGKSEQAVFAETFGLDGKKQLRVADLVEKFVKLTPKSKPKLSPVDVRIQDLLNKKE